MLQITSNAARHLIKVRGERGVDARSGVRLVRRGGRVGITFVGTPATGDQVIAGDGINVFIAAEVADVLDDSTLDARDDGGRTALVMRHARPPQLGI
jgi:Fe-S cluster assembly iron-binding protein IscA